MNFSLIKTISRVDRIIVQRVHGKNWFYAAWVAFASLSMGVIFYVSYTSGSDSNSVVYSLYMTLYMLVVFDLFAVIFRISHNTLIEPVNLGLYPLNKWERIWLHIILLLTDSKSWIYIVTIIVSMFLLIRLQLYVEAIYVVPYIMLLQLSMTVWFVLLLHLMGDIVVKYRKNAYLIGLPVLITLVLFNNYEGIYIFSYIPILHAAVKGFAALFQGELLVASINGFFLIGYILFGLFAFKLIPSKI